MEDEHGLATAQKGSALPFEITPAHLVVLLGVVAVIIAIPVLALGIVLRVAGIGRVNPERRLRERLAHGEISQAEYDAAKRALGI